MESFNSSIPLSVYVDYVILRCALLTTVSIVVGRSLKDGSDTSDELMTTIHYVLKFLVL